MGNIKNFTIPIKNQRRSLYINVRTIVRKMDVIRKMAYRSCLVPISPLLSKYGLNELLRGTNYSRNILSVPELIRYMSMWPKGFEEPVIHKKDFPELRESGDYQVKALAPIKSAPNSATCSLFKDPLVQKFQRLCTLHGRSEQAENNMRETFRLIKHTQLKKYYKAVSSKESESTNADDISITTDPVQII